MLDVFNYTFSSASKEKQNKILVKNLQFSLGMFMHLCSATRNEKIVINKIKILNMLFIIQFIPLNKIHTNSFYMKNLLPFQLKELVSVSSTVKLVSL